MQLKRNNFFQWIRRIYSHLLVNIENCLYRFTDLFKLQIIYYLIFECTLVEWVRLSTTIIVFVSVYILTREIVFFYKGLEEVVLGWY